MDILLKREIEAGINELSQEPENITRVLDDLYKAIDERNLKKVFAAINKLDFYACNYLSKEEYYADLTDFPKKILLKKDHDYYRATYYRLRYHFAYYDIEGREYQNVYSFALHLASNLKTWLDFHLNTMDDELITHMKSLL